VLRTLAEVNSYAYSTAKDALWINLYGSNQLTTKLLGKPLKVTQNTEYPWHGRVTIEIHECPPAEFALKLRLPGWADSPSLRVPGLAEALKVEPNSYAEVRRRWKPGDIVELQLGMEPKLMESHPLVEETSDQVAIKCGPIVYCLESSELPEEIPMENVAISKDTKLRGPFASEVLQGVSVIEADAVLKSSPEWHNELYRPLKRAEETKLKVRFIPYYAWANRGPTEMTVWLPVN
jgi:DUF1680 family protein